MSPQEAHSLWVALHLHFTTDSYDFQKYNGKLKRIPNFTKVNDKLSFSKLSRHKDPKGLIIANFIHDAKGLWIRDLLTTTAQINYLKWLRYQEGINYHFLEEIKLLDRDSFKIAKNQHPVALKKYIKGDISLNTLVIIDQFMNFSEVWDNKLLDDPIWPNVSFTMKKYKGFLQYDKSDIKKIIISWMK